ncbi:MAG: ABC-F family ATP-binding cassette domain-containing protein, partial [Clostridiales bacterium]|nr:ABC-F family ATP-binding cassette domain-containing protein [Clostridiales bacterium]
MIVLACSDISIAYGTDIILKEVSFNLQKAEKASLVGVNGAGKSTLFKMICGMIKPDTGEIFISKGQRIGYLDQGTGPVSGKTIWEDLVSAYSHLIAIEDKMKVLEHKINSEANHDLLGPLVNEYDRLTERYSREGGYEYISRTKGVLRGLGFTDDQFTLNSGTLSGGQKTRLALARLLLEEPDILMLDEPTNHLDIDALEWLEDFLKNYKKSVLIISHDRYFLDATTEKTIELENCRCKTYPGNYSAYAKQKAVEREIQQKHHDLQQKEIARMEAFIEQQRRWNREKNIVAAESRQKAINRIERIDAPDKLPDKIKINLKSNLNSGNDILTTEELAMEYPGKPLFDSVSFSMKKNEHVFLMGPNGCGKSTLLKILLGRLEPTGGSFRFGYNIDVG